MPHRERVRDFWDEVVNDCLDGGYPLPAPLDRWILAYEGAGDGAVDREAFPEPYGGDLIGHVRSVMLGLNPGVSVPAYQYRHGILAEEIRVAGRYSEVFKTHPVNREPWLSDIGPVGYLVNRVAFMRRWLEDDSLSDEHLLTFELYPWHSKTVTAAIDPPPDIIESMIFDPIAETGVRHVFAFGVPWFRVLDSLDFHRRLTLGAGGEPYGSEVASRTAAVYERGDYLIVAVKQNGYAGPPSASEAILLKEALVERRLV